MQATGHVQTSTFPSPFGQYTLLGRLGMGGMAEVLLARQDVMGAPRLLAIKRLHPSLSEDGEARRMFLDEMRIVLGMRHPNIGHVMDVGEVDGSLFLAMEHIEGRDLRRILAQATRRQDPVPLEIAVEIGRQVCAALDHAHTRKAPDGTDLGVVHRDITPDNVIITFDGGVKVVDFGIARANDRLSRTRTGLLKGTPAYMSPEQIQGQAVDGRADVFSLGALLYQATTGEHPFGDASGAGVLLRVLDVTPKPPSEIVPDFPEDLERAILGALEKDPDARWPDAASFAETLDAVVARSGGLISPTRMSRWITGLFPDAAKARATLAADPQRTEAARAANYMGKADDESGPSLPDLEALKAQLGDGTDPATVQVPAEMLWGRGERGEGEKSAGDDGPYVPAGLDLPPLEPAGDPLGAAVMDDAAGGPGAEEIQDQTARLGPPSLARRRPPDEPAAPSDATAIRPAEPPQRSTTAAPEIEPVREEGPAVVPEAVAAPLGPVWSLRDHWNHLPASMKRPWVVALGGAATGLAVLLMGIGLLTVTGLWR
jgi:hypothetical protein